MVETKTRQAADLLPKPCIPWANLRQTGICCWTTWGKVAWSLARPCMGGVLSPSSHAGWTIDPGKRLYCQVSRPWRPIRAPS